MKKQLSIMLTICLVLSVGGNVYLYNQQQQLATQVGNLTAEMATTIESTKQWEQEAIKAQQELDKADAKYKTLSDELVAAKSKLAEAEKAAVEKAAVQTTVGKDVETGIPEGGITKPDGTIDNNTTGKPVADKPLPGSTGTKAPGKTKKEQINSLQPGEAMDPRGYYISINKIYDGCYINKDGVIYCMVMGKIKPWGGGATTGSGTPYTPGGEAWG